PRNGKAQGRIVFRVWTAECGTGGKDLGAEEPRCRQGKLGLEPEKRITEKGTRRIGFHEETVSRFVGPDPVAGFGRARIGARGGAAGGGGAVGQFGRPLLL